MAACLRGVGPATACDASWLQLTEAIHLWSDGAWLAQAAPGAGHSHRSPRGGSCACLLSLGAPQVVAVPMPRRHAAMLYSSNHCVHSVQVHMVMAAAWRRACAASAPRRPAPPPGCSSQRPSTRGLVVHGLLRLHLGRSQPSVRTRWLVGLCAEPGGAAGRCRADAVQARRHAVCQ